MTHSNDHSYPPFSDNLPLDTQLKISQWINDDEIKKRVESSQSQCLENVPTYPALLILALFANLAYKDADKISPALVEAHGWHLMATGESEKGYFGAAFWHPENHQLAIAHRGTVFKLSNFWCDVIRADLCEVYFNMYGHRMSSAATFAEKVLTIFHKVFNDSKYTLQLFFTGHSLGGWLAQITTFTTEYLRPIKTDGCILFQNASGSTDISTWPYHAHTVVFESPGCASMLRKMRKSFDVRSGYCSIDLDTLDITTYLAAPNIINICDEHVGTYYRLFTDLSKLGTDKNWLQMVIDYFTTWRKRIKYTLKTHSIKEIQQLLKDLAEESDSEIRKKVREIVDWPNLGLPLMKTDCEKLFEDGRVKLDTTLKDCTDANKLCLLRYQTKDFDERTGHLSAFTTPERIFLERYVLIRELGCFVFGLDELFSCLQIQDQEDARRLLGGCSIDGKKFCSTAANPNKFVPFVKTLLKVYPLTDDIIQKRFSSKGVAKQVFKSESESYQDNFDRKWKSLDLDDNSHVFRDFIDEKYRIQHVINGGTTVNKKIGMRLIYSAMKKSLQQKITINITQITILKLQRLLYLLQLGINVQHTFKDEKHWMLVDCKELEINVDDEALIGRLFTVVADKIGMKLIFVTNNEKQGKTIKDLIGKHHLDRLSNQTNLPKLNLIDLTPECRTQLLCKSVLLAGSPDETSLHHFLGESQLLELNADAMIEVVNAKEYIYIGPKPQLLSDSDNAYTECVVKIEAANLFRKLVDDCKTLFIIDGSPFCNPREFIEQLMEDADKDADSAENPRVRVSPDDQVGKNIRLVSGEYSENEFRKFCRAHSTDQIQWFSYKSLRNEWFWMWLYDPNFYVGRELNQIAVLETIRSNLKDKNSNESFVVSGITSEELLKLLGIRKEDDIISSRLSVVEDSENIKFERNPLVHHLKVETNCGVQQMVRQLSPNPSRNEFFALEGDPLSIIVDQPGMGKSTTLTWLTEERLSENWVMRLNLNDCSSLLSQLIDVQNMDQVTNFLWTGSGGEAGASLAKDIFKHHLKSHEATARPLLLLFDGFDEIIDLNHQRTIIKLLEQLRIIFRNSNHQIVVTSRRHPELEKKLNVLYTVEFTPLDREHQIQFLKNHWFHRSELLISDLDAVPSKSKRYAKEVLEKADTTLGEKNAPFIGVPMQLRLLAEGFRDQFLKFANSGESIPVLKSMSLVDIYEFFVRAKYDVLYREKTAFSEKYPVYERWLREKLTKNHQRSALTIFFSEEDNKLFGEYSLPNDELVELYRVGIIQKTRNREGFEFIHFTFVEYYVAGFLIRKLEKLSQSTMNFFLDDILSKPKYIVVRNFLDKMLATRVDKFRKETQKHSRNEEVIFMHVAAYEGNSEIIKFLFEVLDEATLVAILSCSSTKDDLCKYAFARTPLQVATESGHVHIVQQLLENGLSNVRQGDSENETALHMAARGGYSEIVKLLLTKIEEEERNETTRENCAVNLKGGFREETALHIAVRMGHGPIARILSKAKNVDIDTHSGFRKNVRTPLYMAAEQGNVDIVRILLEEDATIYPDTYEAASGNEEVLTALLECEFEHQSKGPDKCKVDINGQLHLAATTDKILFLQYLLSLEKINVNARNKDNTTALHLAVKSNKVENVKALLSDRNVDVNARDNDRMTPLHLAAKSNKVKNIKALLSKRNIGVNVTDKNHMTPLHLAVNSFIVENVKTLLSAKKVDVNARDKYNMTPLHLAAKSFNVEIVKALLSANKVDVNATDKDNKTPLHLASESYNVENVKALLLAEKVDVNARDKDKKTPLHLAAESYVVENVKTLLSADNVYFNARDKDNMTPLHLAAKSNKVKNVKTLLSAKKVDFNVKGGCDKKTPMQLASDGGHAEIVELLSNHC